MPTAYGNDRIVASPGGKIVLISPARKEWQPRRQRTAGTAVEWDDELYEVLEETPHPGGTRYVLALWDDRNAIRQTSRYDAAWEAARSAVRDEERRTNRASAVLFFAGVVVGHLPAFIQNRIEARYGISAARMTMISTVPFFLFGAFCATRVPVPEIDRFLGTPALSGGTVALGIFLFLESVFRLRWALGRGPIASIAGFVLTLPVRFFLAPAKGTRVRVDSIGPSRDVALADAYHVREPFIALLPPDDQALMKRRFGFDPILWGKRTAMTILTVTLLGIFVELSVIISGFGSFGDFLSLVAAGALSGEQLWRLTRLRGGAAAGSVLGIPLRRLLKPLLQG
ncbi:MAG: hypothetical protein ACYC7A_11640 [Thermoanaerobaculia bacterium]